MIANYAAALSRAGHAEELAQLMNPSRLLRIVRLDSELGVDLATR